MHVWLPVTCCVPKTTVHALSWLCVRSQQVSEATLQACQGHEDARMVCDAILSSAAAPAAAGEGPGNAAARMSALETVSCMDAGQLARFEPQLARASELHAEGDLEAAAMCLLQALHEAADEQQAQQGLA
jgi:hypothetical protein